MTIKVRDILKRLHDEGWVMKSIEGSHRQFKHPVKPGKVTVSGKPSHDVHPATWNSIQKQAGWK